MRLYVLEDGKKTYINYFATTRRELLCLIGSPDFRIGSNFYHINDIQAEYDDYVILGTVLGALIGIFLGPLGMAFGAVAGFLFESTKMCDDREKAAMFNESIVKS